MQLTGTITRDSLLTLEAYAKVRKASKPRGHRAPPPAQRAAWAST